MPSFYAFGRDFKNHKIFINFFVRIRTTFVSTIKKSMYKKTILSSESGVVQHKTAHSYENPYTKETDVSIVPLGLYETVATYNDNKPHYQLYIDEQFNIFLPMNGNITIKMEPLPKAIYILFLYHPEGILLKNISDYRSEIEYIYRKVSRRKNPTVINRLLDDVTNPTNNMLHKNLSIIRTAFLNKLPAEVADFFIPIRNRGRKQYILLDVSEIKLPKNLQLKHKNSL